MMFRRRTTDQVYATLQQVQRRITEQGTAVAQGAKPAGRPMAPVITAAVPTQVPPPAAPVETPPPVVMPPPGTIPIPVSLATTLVLVCLVSIAGAYALGIRQGRNDVPTATAPPVRPTGDAEPPPAKRLGNALYVLRAVPTFTPQLKQQWQAEADRLNAVMRQNEARGWKPWFAIREPENGGLQFVFGYANGQFGIDRGPFEEFARLLAAPTTKNGGGYSQAKWMTLD